MSVNWWALIRHLGTVALAVLIAAQQYYPSVHWIAIAILTLGILGFQVVPTSPPVYKMTVNAPPPQVRTYPGTSTSAYATGGTGGTGSTTAPGKTG